MSETEPSGLPLFYSAVEPLDKERHASLGLVREHLNFRFAAQASAVPVNTAEFNLAMKSSPIVFTTANEPQPIAVLGLQRDENLFVKPDGSWQEGAYVPVYIRRYPFIFGAVQAEDQFAFCVDTGAAMVSESPDLPFFENGELSEVSQRGVEVCQVFQQQRAATRDMMEKLAASGLLEKCEAKVTARNGTEHVLGSYIGIKEEKLKELSDDQFMELRHNGLLPLIYLHLASLSNWMRLLDLHALRHPPAGAAQTQPDAGTVPPPGA